MASGKLRRSFTMKPKHRSSIETLETWTEVNQLTLHRMAHRLTSHAKELPADFVGLQSAVLVCQQAIAQLQTEVNDLYESDAMSALRPLTVPLTDNEISQLLDLNHRLQSITRYLQTVVDDVKPRLDAKVTDPNDPMYDYEIDARLDYQLREDDPDYAEDDDNGFVALVGSDRKKFCVAGLVIKRRGCRTAVLRTWLSPRDGSSAPCGSCALFRYLQ